MTGLVGGYGWLSPSPFNNKLRSLLLQADSPKARLPDHVDKSEAPRETNHKGLVATGHRQGGGIPQVKLTAVLSLASFDLGRVLPPYSDQNF